MKDEITNRLGCLTFNGLVGGLAVVLLLLISGLISGGRMFSPGGLNARPGQAALGGVMAHAEIKSCSTCHAPPWSGGSMVDQCLVCHTDLVQDPNNFHNLMINQSKKTGCIGCHTDHGGPSASLTAIDFTNFPHDQTGFSLLAHRKMANGSSFKCTDCHANGYTGFDAAVCTTCHAALDAVFMQGHAATFGQGCLACHDGKDSYGKNFDHQKLAFILTGKHTTAGCNQCHSQEQSISAMRATPQGCFACHAKDDAHHGQFGQDCSACHTTTGWQPATFDHSKSGFPLTGGHLQVACSKCHLQGANGTIFKGTPTACVGCHADPAYHQGLFGTDCASCHTTTAYSPAKFDSPHPFPIDHGNRGNNQCKSCHPDTLNTYTCSTCHDPAQTVRQHEGATAASIANCVKCHATGRGGD